MTHSTSLQITLTSLFLLVCAPVAAQRGNPPIKIAKSQTYSDNILGLNQDVIVRGTAEGDLGAISGSIYVHGTVTGNISVLNGSVIIQDGGRVSGTIVCIRGDVEVNNSGAVDGKIINFLRSGSMNQASSLLSTTKARLSFFFALALCLYLLVMVTFYIFPNQVSEASFELEHDLMRPAIFGVTTLAVFISLLLLSFMLMAVAIGFPLFLLFFCGLVVVETFGLVVVFYRLGQLIESVSRSMVSVFTGVLLAVLATVLLISLPVVGFLLALALLTFGSGIVMATRFGTNKQWFTRKARYYSAG